MDEYESKLLKLVSFDTSRFNINESQYNMCADYIFDIFADIGFIMDKIKTSKGYVVIGKFFQNKKFSHIHFNGHYDVVSPTLDEQFGYNKEAMIFFGRGCSDMKGGIISIWLACKKAIKSNIECNYSVSFSPDEETGGQNGSAKLVEEITKHLPYDSIIIIADSSYPKIIGSHRGAYWINVTISLESVKRFSTDVPSAFEIMCRYYKDFISAPDNIEMLVFGGLCRTSDVVNMWTHTVSFSIDYRFDSQNTLDKVKLWVDDNLLALNKKIKNDLSLETIPLSWERLLEVDFCSCSCNMEQYVSTAREIIHDVALEMGRGFYDLRLFRNAGYANSFVLGPGDTWNAHAKNEILPNKNIIDCSKAYVRYMEEIACGTYKRSGID